MKKLFILFLSIFFILSFSKTYSKILCGSVSGYALYKCRVDDICKKYYDGPKKEVQNFFNKDKEYDNESIKNIDAMGRQVYRTFPYLNAGDYYKDKNFLKKFKYNDYSFIPFEIGVETYKNNMNGIYRCAILYTRRKVLKNIEKLIKEDRSGEIRKAIKKNLKAKIKKVEDLISKQAKADSIFEGTCRNINSTTISKREILREVTYETCKFRTYMEYLKGYYSDNIKHLVRPKVDKNGKQEEIGELSPADFGLLEDEILAKIEDQVRHSYLVFDKAFKEYSLYETNYYIHEMLELMKVEFIVLRIKLHNVLTPINQLVYKISNAMKLQ